MSSLAQITIDHLLKRQLLGHDEAALVHEKLLSGEQNIGELLLEQEGFICETLKDTLIELYKKGEVELETLNSEFSIDTDAFLVQLAAHLNFEYMDLDATDIDYRMATRVPLSQLKKYHALPIKEDEINAFVALKDPIDIHAQEGLQRLFGNKLVKIVVADPQQIDKHLGKMVLSESIKGLIVEIRKELSSSAADTSQQSSSILKLIETILKTAILARASDIHIEPTENHCIVRSRIDGMLSETFMFDKDIYPPLASRMKLLSNMDIAEKRKPQDGRFSSTILGKEYDFRISALPIMHGESIVVRILDKSKVLIKLENLGMHPENFTRFAKAMRSPYGIVFVTGPTGSGKTTTLYAALNAIKSVETKIITVEDPVEYQLGLIQQAQVNEKANLTFSSALRSILRQDPDIIMIGEVRDQETLRIAIQAALTGHLVFSTLHTNDAISAISRVLDMGIESYLVSGALVAIEAQRLVRKLCPHCKAKINLPHTLYQQFKTYLPEHYTFYKHTGCEACAQTGYLGREMLSEILPVSETIASMIAQGEAKEHVRQQALKEGFIDIFQDGIRKAAEGITTIDEVLRVAKA